MSGHEQQSDTIIDINEGAAPDSYRWGIIGFGKIALAHALGIKRAGHRLLCFSTSNVAVQSGDARALKCNLGIDGFRFNVSDMISSSGYRDLLKLDVDGFIICAPTQFHREIAIEVARAGKDCLIEKPIAPNGDDANEILNAFKPDGPKVAVAHELPAFPAYAFLHKLLGTMDMSTLQSLEMHRHVSWDALNTDAGIAQGTGFVPDLGIHDVDLILHHFPDAEAEWSHEGGQEIVNEKLQNGEFNLYTDRLNDTQRLTVSVGIDHRYSGFAHHWRLTHMDGTGYWFDGKDVWHENHTGQVPQKMPLDTLSTEEVFALELTLAADYFTGRREDCDFLSHLTAINAVKVFDHLESSLWGDTEKS